jgi:hypothetical protein
VEAVDRSSPSTERRRSQRVFQPVSLIVHGMDVLGQHFHERATAIDLNLHGCRYASRHHPPKNAWVTLEVPAVRSSVRARVTLVQHPNSIRELFQVSLELERPINIWGLDPNPLEWERVESSTNFTISPARENLRVAEASEAHTVPTTLATLLEKMAAPMTNASPEFSSWQEPGTVESTEQPIAESGPETQAPFPQGHSDTIERAIDPQTRAAAEAMENQVGRTLEEFQRRMNETERLFAERLAARQNEFERGWKLQLDNLFDQSRDLLARFEGTAECLRSETQEAKEVMGHLAQLRLQIEAAEASRNTFPVDAPVKEGTPGDHATADWRERLRTEMGLAQAQWKELLDSSLDGGAERLAGLLSTRAQDVLR